MASRSESSSCQREKSVHAPLSVRFQKSSIIWTIKHNRETFLKTINQGKKFEINFLELKNFEIEFISSRARFEKVHSFQWKQFGWFAINCNWSQFVSFRNRVSEIFEISLNWFIKLLKFRLAKALKCWKSNVWEIQTLNANIEVHSGNPMESD